MIVFAYGSNMDTETLDEHEILEETSRREAATLAGYRLAWNHQPVTRPGGAANAEVAPGESLPGVALWVTARGLALIDVKEGRPTAYERHLVSIVLASGEALEAWVYVSMRPEPGDIWPPRAYRDAIVRGAEAHGLAPAHIRVLKATRTRD